MKCPDFFNNNQKGLLMIRVAEVITDTNIGGAGRLLLNRIKNSDIGRFHYVVVLPKGSALLSLLKENNIEFFEVNCGYDRSFDFKSVLLFYNAFKKIRPHIVNAHGALSARIASKLARIPIKLYTRHCDFPTGKIFNNVIVKGCMQFLSNLLSDGIIAVSFSARDNLVRLGIKHDKIKVIINGVDMLKEISDDDKKTIKAALNIPHDANVISIFARLEKYKDHNTFLHAAKELVQSKKCYFLIVGGGTEEDNLKSLVRELGIDEYIRFIGFVKDVYLYMNITDINVNCSIGTETSSLALSEGMSLGIPSIVSDYPGNVYMVHQGENGLIYPRQDHKMLARKIDILLKDKALYSHISENAKIRFENEFNAKKMAFLTEKYYEKFLKEKGYYV